MYAEYFLFKALIAPATFNGVAVSLLRSLAYSHEPLARIFDTARKCHTESAGALLRGAFSVQAHFAVAFYTAAKAA